LIPVKLFGYDFHVKVEGAVPSALFLRSILDIRLLSAGHEH